MDAHRNGTKTIYCLYKNPLIHLCFSTGTHRYELLSTTILYRGSHQDTLRIIQMFRKKRYVRPFISRKPVRTPLTYIQIDQICRIELGIFAVALCEEGVDRNCGQRLCPGCAWVALCEEGVDRNSVIGLVRLIRPPSPSAKRAWIEIEQPPASEASVRSPSAKRAWIEIRARPTYPRRSCVALCEEGVDRNDAGKAQRYVF